MDINGDGHLDTTKWAGAGDGVHQLVLTGDANDTAVFAANEWVDTGKTATNNGHTYEVYSAANGAAAQLLIDQHMLMAHAG